jgi:hypothetical protein
MQQRRSRLPRAAKDKTLALSLAEPRKRQRLSPSERHAPLPRMQPPQLPQPPTVADECRTCVAPEPPTEPAISIAETISLFAAATTSTTTTAAAAAAAAAATAAATTAARATVAATAAAAAASAAAAAAAAVAADGDHHHDDDHDHDHDNDEREGLEHSSNAVQSKHDALHPKHASKAISLISSTSDLLGRFPALPSSFKHIASMPGSWPIGPVLTVSFGFWVTTTDALHRAEARDSDGCSVSRVPIVALCHTRGVSVWALDASGASLMAQWPGRDPDNPVEWTLDSAVVADESHQGRTHQGRPNAHRLTIIVSSTHASRGGEMHVLHTLEEPNQEVVRTLKEGPSLQLESHPGANVTEPNSLDSKICSLGSSDVNGNSSQVVLWAKSGVAARVLLRDDWAEINQICTLPHSRHRRGGKKC